MALIGPKSDQFWIKIGYSFHIYEPVDWRFQDLYVDVDFAQILVVDCRQNRKKVVESTKCQTPPGPPLRRYEMIITT